VSFNKVFAKLGSDMKKPDAVTVLSKENFKEKAWRSGQTKFSAWGTAPKSRCVLWVFSQ
jgi:nucleotidyltransferase/DNA polymerase involved in DNA repair